MPTGPYKGDGPNAIYVQLFADDLQGFLHGHDVPAGYPWTTIYDTAAEKEALLSIGRDKEVDARLRLLAYHRLRTSGVSIEEKDILGVVVEVGMDLGLDALGVYPDGVARYINYTESMVIWDAPDAVSREIATQLMQDSLRIVQQIGPWEGPRKAPPPKGNVRISFLVSDGLYFGEGPINVLFNDPMGGPALQSATAMMQYITEKAAKQQI